MTILLPPGGEAATLREIVAAFPARVIHRSLAGRAQDVLDIESIVARQGNALDLAYVRRWPTELARVSDDPGVTVRFERAWAAYGPGR